MSSGSGLAGMESKVSIEGSEGGDWKCKTCHQNNLSQTIASEHRERHLRERIQADQRARQARQEASREEAREREAARDIGLDVSQVRAQAALDQAKAAEDRQRKGRSSALHERMVLMRKEERARVGGSRGGFGGRGSGSSKGKKK